MQMPDMCDSAGPGVRNGIFETTREENQGRELCDHLATCFTHDLDCLRKVYICETIHLCCFWHGFFKTTHSCCEIKWINKGRNGFCGFSLKGTLFLENMSYTHWTAVTVWTVFTTKNKPTRREREGSEQWLANFNNSSWVFSLSLLLTGVTGRLANKGVTVRAVFLITTGPGSSGVECHLLGHNSNDTQLLTAVLHRISVIYSET